MKKKKNPISNLLVFILVVVILISVGSTLWESQKPKPPTYSEICREFKSENVDSFIIDSDKQLNMTLKDGKKISFDLSDPYIYQDFFRDNGERIKDQRDRGVIREDDRHPAKEESWFVMFLPYIIVILGIALMWFFMFSKGGGAGNASRFGKARTKMGQDEKKKVTFDDVAGADEEKEELAEIVEFLKNPKKFVDIGARIPKGVLLVGPPGTGKTYIAKAVAGEAGVPFLSISGSDFVELYVGVGASRVRDLFEQAKKNSPAIIFIDEIDAVGRHRGAGYGGGHDEREQTLNQLLVEMDGFGNNEGVIIIAATNRPDILDPALTRPGRFDRQVYVGVPDIKGREAVLKIHAKKKKVSNNVDFATVAKSTSGFTPADLENLLNEAALLAARQGRDQIVMKDIEDSMIKVIAGPEKKAKVRSAKDNKLVAYHEAGHALAMKFLPTQDPVHQITIIPRGQAGGMTISLPQEDEMVISRTKMQETIVSLLGGRVAEQLVLDDISTGASNDIQRASAIARDMVTKYGMSEKLGPISFASDHDEVFLGRDFASKKSFSENVASLIDTEVKDIVDSAYSKCTDILNQHMDKLHEIAAYLLEHEVMDDRTFYALFDESVPGKEEEPTVEEKTEQ